MSRFWNLQTKFVVVLIVLLLGSLVAQSYVHQQGKGRLRAEVLKLTEDLANEVTQKVPKVFLVGVQVPQVVVHRVQLNTTGRAGGERRRPGKIWEAETGASVRNVRIIFNPKRFADHLSEKYEEYQNCLNPAPSVRDLVSAQGEPRSRKGSEPTLQSLEHDADEDRWMRQLPGSAVLYARGPGNDDGAAGPSLPNVGSNLSGLTSEAPDPVNLGDYTDRVDRLLDDDRRKTLLSLLAIFLSGIGAAWFLGSRITRPVHSLVEGFQRVADGDLATRVPERSRGEFGLLGRQFNSMVGRLRNSRQLQRELELRERVQHMGDLAAGVAHDVRNPLNAIYLNIGQIRDEFLPSGADKQQRFLRFTSDIQSEVERLNELVTNFLSLAQPSSGDREVVAPNELVEDLGRLLDKEAASRHVTIATTLDEGIPTLQSNQQELRSAFLNVAMNAIQAMDADGEGRLDIVTGLRPADESVGRPAEVAISFIDSGCGISQEQLEQIFIPYFTTREGGTGLGMAISRRIAERYDGRIEVRSKVGEGTTVSFVFPAVPADIEATSQAALPETPEPPTSKGGHA
ncbi:MAG: ATP-binding protein [Planctomycetota bacterium]